jgi:hypothetical protein
MIANYVCASGKHYPLEFRRFRKKEACVAAGEPFKNHSILCKELIDWMVDQAIPGDFTFDSYFTNAEILNHIDSKKRNYVGDLKFNRTITVDGKDWKASDWAKTQLGPLYRRKTTVDGKEQWYFTKSIRIPGVMHTVRIVVLWKRQRDTEPRKILMSNRTYWEVHGILKVYRKRWTIPEIFHRDGKQHLGMGECQLRKGESQTRHMYLVFLAYSALMTQLRHDRALLLGSLTPDDHRRVLSRHVSRDLGKNHRLGGRADPAGAESARNQGPFGPTLTLQNYS